MSKKESSFSKLIRLVILLFFAGLIIKMIITNTAAFLSILVVLLGFGAVIMIHEFGHFIVAKLGGIKIEAFSIGFPPTFLGIQKTAEGLRFRILPRTIVVEDEESDEDKKSEPVIIDDALIQHTIKIDNCKPNETEYRIGMIPFGGFVKMLGQEDAGSVEESKDPRSFANKSASIKIAVVAAGVTFNAISAILIFMAVYMIGIDVVPAVIGDVAPNSPAYVAGIRPGDRVLDIEGETFLDFMSIAAAAALTDEGEPVHLTVEHYDGTVEDIEVVSAFGAMSGMPIRGMGVSKANTLNVPEADKLSKEEIEKLTKNGLSPGDKIVSAAGNEITQGWQLDREIYNALAPSITLGVERNNESEMIQIDRKLTINTGTGNFTNELDLTNIYTMVPRLKVNGVVYNKEPETWQEHVLAFWSEKILRHKKSTDPQLKKGDIITAVGGKQVPTYAEVRQITTEYKDKELPITVTRTDKDGVESQIETTVIPHALPSRSDEERVTIGISIVLDIDNPIVASTIESQNGMKALEIPRGARITAVNGQEVSTFWEVIAKLRANTGKEATVNYATESGSDEIRFTVSEADLNARTIPAEGIPVETLKELSKTESPVKAIKMGVKKVRMFIGQSLTTLRGLFTGTISPKALSGPLGIVSASYSIVQDSFIDFVYFMAIISSILAVMNLLPLPIVDGGVIILILIEKIKGSPVSVKVQEVIAYAGLLFIGLLFAWLLFNDFLNMLFL
ncbi:MAG: site-2 protease family protein [Anaerohalosphaera sp.]|nr:site-2 protease family protein [Anaerohalosphaera sp.]